MTFDPTKPVQTRDGRKARIIYYDYKGIRGESMVAMIDKGNGKESVGAYYENGSLVMSVESGLDLINIPEENDIKPNSEIERLENFISEQQKRICFLTLDIREINQRLRKLENRE